MKESAEPENKRNSRPSSKIWKLALYVANQRPSSLAALTNINRICCERLEDRCRIAVIDLETSPGLAKKMEILAVPTLVRTSPPPVRRVIGNLSNTERVLKALDIDSTASA